MKEIYFLFFIMFPIHAARRWRINLKFNVIKYFTQFICKIIKKEIIYLFQIHQK